MRRQPLQKIGDYKVIALRDYQADTRLLLEDNTVTSTGLPKSNVLYYELERGAWCCVRPSGTEPKVKFYMGVKEESLKAAEAALNGLKEAMIKIVE